MTPSDFAFLARLLLRRSGLVLTRDKMKLAEGRLMPVARRFGFRNPDLLIAELRHSGGALAHAVTEAMTTNESSFFRDGALFECFRARLLSDLIAARADEKRLRIWSAACAAGQEPYSIAMILDDLGLPAQGWAIDLIATDLSSEAVARAEGGLYTKFEVERGLRSADLAGHFRAEGENWRIAEHLRRMVTFRCFNLLDSYGWLDDIDIVFCRNVLLYFDQTIRGSVIDRIAEILKPDGFLLLGETEAAPLATVFAATPYGAGIYGHARAPARLSA